MAHEPIWDSLENNWTSDIYCDIISSEESIIASTSFFPGARGKQTNVIFCSSDYVHFFLDWDSLSDICVDAFHGELTDTKYMDNHAFGLSTTFIPESSSVLDVMLHFLHNLAFSNDIPSFQAFIDAISAMSKYNIDPALLLIPSNPCFNHILFFAPAHPVEVYSLAAKFDLYPLAVAASSHLLSYPLQDISDENATLMGATYLRKLCALHAHRLEMLKSITMQPPYPHPPTEKCDFLRQRQLTRAWKMTAAHYIWEARCDLSAAEIRSSFDNLKTYVDCGNCREMLDYRVKDVISQWVLVKRTI